MTDEELNIDELNAEVDALDELDINEDEPTKQTEDVVKEATEDQAKGIMSRLGDVPVENVQFILNKSDRPNSTTFRYGGTGTDTKIYFEDAQDLLDQLEHIRSVAEKVNNTIADIKRLMQERSE